MTRTTMFTTSWDDGSRFDVRIGQLLEALGMSGTFYASTGEGGRRSIDDRDLERIGLHHELGNHGRTHTPFPLLSGRRIIDELEWADRELSRFGSVVRVVAPPKGKMDRRIVRTIQREGYAVRSAPILGTKATDSLWIEPSFLFRPVGFVPILRNALHRRAFPTIPLLLAWGRGGRFRDQSLRLLRAAVETMPVVHVWGHGWEVERLDLWRVLGDLLAAVSRLDVQPVTNGQSMAAGPVGRSIARRSVLGRLI